MEPPPAAEYISQGDESDVKSPIMEGSPAEEYVSQEDESDFDSEEFEDETSARVREVEEALPGNMAVREVVGAHTTPCSDCGKSSWGYGEYYVYDAQQPWGSDKFCLDCAHMKYCQISENEAELAEEEEDAATEIEDELVEKGYTMVSDVDLLHCTSDRCVRELQALVAPKPPAPKPPQGVLVCGQAGLVINKLSFDNRPCCSVCKSKWERFWFCNAKDFAKVKPQPLPR